VDKGKLVEQFIENLRVDVSVYNSKFYYVITDGGGYGEQVIRIPSTGNELVLDALSAIQGLPPQASKKKIWVARAIPAHNGAPHILPVDWCGITQRGEGATNYQIFPGDRIYVKADKWIKADSWLAKRLAPIERVLGTTLLGASTVNAIKGNTGGNGSGTR
jgi:polysaccharide export outer membrane protein